MGASMIDLMQTLNVFHCHHGTIPCLPTVPPEIQGGNETEGLLCQEHALQTPKQRRCPGDSEESGIPWACVPFPAWVKLVR
jgi:hypothetical protein